MGKFANAIGIWDLKVGDVEFELKPKKGDNLKLMKVMMNDRYQKDKAALMEDFTGFMIKLIHRDHPNEPLDEIQEFVEMNVNDLFQETLVAFRWQKREDIDKLKKETWSETKKLIEGD